MSDHLTKTFAKKVTAAMVTITLIILGTILLVYVVGSYFGEKEFTKTSNFFKSQLSSKGYTYDYIAKPIKSNTYGMTKENIITVVNLKDPNGVIYSTAVFNFTLEEGDGGGVYPSKIQQTFPGSVNILNLR